VLGSLVATIDDAYDADAVWDSHSSESRAGKGEQKGFFLKRARVLTFELKTAPAPVVVDSTVVLVSVAAAAA